jgi:polar amino acid transport system ATP-binding protein/sulfate transport system ATP-binding protein
MPALYPYTYGDTLLKIDNVCLSASADGLRLLEKEGPGSRSILKNVTAEVKKINRDDYVNGQIVGFIGPSGIGKTQLFRIIAGLSTPTSGAVYVNRESTPVRAGEVGVVAQNYPQFAHRTVMGNLQLAARRREKDPKVAHDKIMDLLNEFGLADKAHLYPAQLSGGQRQRIAIIQQILGAQHYLLMDEPFSGLDIIVEGKATDLIMKVANRDGLNTVIVVTHDISAAASIADHIWALGRQFDVNGTPTPGLQIPSEQLATNGGIYQPLDGATIVKTYDLIERGLCWTQMGDHAMVQPNMVEFIREVKSDFYHF